MNVAPYRKLVVAVAGVIAALVSAIVAAVSDGVLDLNDVVGVFIAVLTAIGVYSAPNDTRPPLDVPEA